MERCSSLFLLDKKIMDICTNIIILHKGVIYTTDKNTSSLITEIPPKEHKFNNLSLFGSYNSYYNVFKCIHYTALRAMERQAWRKMVVVHLKVFPQHSCAVSKDKKTHTHTQSQGTWQPSKNLKNLPPE
jgi:hypothetical protein